MDMVLWPREYFIDLLSDLRRECQCSAMTCGAEVVLNKWGSHTLQTLSAGAAQQGTESGAGQLRPGALVTYVLHFLCSEMLIIKST